MSASSQIWADAEGVFKKDEVIITIIRTNEHDRAQMYENKKVGV